MNQSPVERRPPDPPEPRSAAASGFVLVTLVVAALVGGVLASTARAGSSDPVIYTTFGAGASYALNDGWCVNNNGACTGSYETAAKFTPSANYELTRIDLGLTHFGAGNAATVQLAADGGGFPGTVLRAWSVSGQPDTGTCCRLTTLNATSSAVLAGKTYWVVVSAAGSDSFDLWMDGPVVGTAAQNSGSGWFSTGGNLPAFDVQGISCKLCKAG